jgi:hypothetical protein
MDFSTTVDLIIRELDDACRIIEDLGNQEGVPALQVELAMSKCRSAARVIELLKNISPPTAKEPSAATPPGSGHGSREKPGGSSIIADTFSHLPNSLNEKIGSERGDNDKPGLSRSKPLTNLSEAIGVNDRFLFIREIFGGNVEQYNQAISNLDNAASMDDARSLIAGYSGNTPESKPVSQLLDLVRLKFLPDE